MNHLTVEQLSALMDDALPATERAALEAHVASCEMCRTALEELRAADVLFAETHLHDPGDAYFATFAARVAERIGAAGRPAAAADAAHEAAGEIEPDALADALPPARPARETSPWYDIGSWFRTPRRLVWVGGVAAVIVAAGVVLMIARESGVPELRDAKLLERGAQSDAPPAAPAAPGASGAPSATAPSATAPEAAAPQAARQRPLPAPDADAAGGNEATSRPAAPARVREMKQGPGGEPLPVAPPRGVPGFAREAPPPPAPAPGESIRIRRDRRAQPLAGTAEGEAKQEESKPRAEAPRAGTDALAPPPAVAKSLSPGGAAGAGRMSLEQQGGACGAVVDAKGRPVAKAQVVVGARGVTATSADDGRFCFDLPAGDYDLTVFAVGFTPLRRTVSFGDPEAPVRLVLRTVEVLPPPAQGAPAPPPPPPPAAFAFEGLDPAVVPRDLPDSVRTRWEDAQRVMGDAVRERSAVRFDAAAEAWNAVAAALLPGEARTMALEHRADARYAAWTIEPTGPRREEAGEALRQLLGALPPGPRHDLARERLDRVLP